MLPQAGAQLRVDPHRRLIEQQQFRLVQQRHRETDPPPLATRQLADLARGFRQVEEIDEPRLTFPDTLDGHAMQAAVEAHALGDREVLVEGDLLRAVADGRTGNW